MFRDHIKINYNEEIFYYQISKLNPIINTIILHFEKYPLISQNYSKK